MEMSLKYGLEAVKATASLKCQTALAMEEKNREEAYRLFSQAAEAGDHEAARNVAMWKLSENELEQAETYFKKAAENPIVAWYISRWLENETAASGEATEQKTFLTRLYNVIGKLFRKEMSQWDQKPLPDSSDSEGDAAEAD